MEDKAREVTPDYVARLFQQRSEARMIRFDEQTVAGGTLADLNEALWRRFETRQSGAEAREAFLHKLGLAGQDEEMVWRPTVAGVLMAGEDLRRFLPNAFIQAVAYRGTSSTPGAGASGYPLDAADITGPLDRQVLDAHRFVAGNMRTGIMRFMARRFDCGCTPTG